MDYRPDTYDITTAASVLGDAAWYRERARRIGGRVLELGAGTGRITLGIADDGVEVWALDASQAMLTALETKRTSRPPEVQSRVHTVLGDMRRFELAERFSFVIIPYRAFLHNLTEADQLACLRCVRRHLAPGGTLAFNVFHPSLEFMSRNAGTLANVWRHVTTHPLPHGGCLTRADAVSYETPRRLVHAQHRYDEWDASGVLTRSTLHSFTLSYLYPSDIQHLLADAGFEDITIYGGFDERPFERDADELVVTAR
ncbi:MAG: methyltransferase domain-containing protein [Vicinamibacterales bacterium]